MGIQQVVHAIEQHQLLNDRSPLSKTTTRTPQANRFLHKPERMLALGGQMSRSTVARTMRDFRHAPRSARKQRTHVAALLKTLRSGDASSRRGAILALNSMNPVPKAAIPALITALNDIDSFVRITAIGALAKAGAPAVPALIKLLRSSNQYVFLRAIKPLGKMGPAAKAAIPALVSKIGGFWGSQAAWVLGKIGRAAVPALTKLLRTGNATVQERAAQTLGNIGPKARSAEKALSRLLDDKNADGKNLKVKIAAIMALGKIKTKDRSALRKLRISLNDARSSVRSAALEALGSIGPGAIPTLIGVFKKLRPELRLRAVGIFKPHLATSRTVAQTMIKALGDTNSSVRTAALDAISLYVPLLFSELIRAFRGSDSTIRSEVAYVFARSGAHARSAVPDLIKAVGGNDRKVKLASIYALGRIGKAAATAVRTLIPLLRDVDSKVRSAAALALGSMAPASQGAISYLVPLLGDHSWRARSQAETALIKFGRSAVPDLIRGLSHKNPRTVAGAASSLGRLKDIRAVPSLIKLLRHPVPFYSHKNDFMHAVVFALVSIARTSPATRTTLIKLLRHSNENIRRGSAIVLKRLGSRVARASSGTLLKDLESRDVKVRRRAVKGIVRLHAVTTAMIPGLMRALSDPDPNAKYYAIAALGKLGPRARVAVPELKKILLDHRSSVRSVAAQTLGRIGPAAKSAIPALIMALFDNNDRYLRECAAEALGKLGSAAKWAIPALTRASARSHEDESVKKAATLALKRLGPATSAEVPRFLMLLRSTDSAVRAAIARGLGNVGPAARAAYKALGRLLNDPNKAVRNAAVWALNQI